MMGDNLLKYMADYLQNVEKNIVILLMEELRQIFLRYAFLIKMRKRSQTL